MALKFRLRGLAETFIDSISCPCCGKHGVDDTHFSTEHTKVTYDGIIIVVQCKSCGEIFVPQTQRLGVLSPVDLKDAVVKDSDETGDTLLESFQSVKLHSEKLNTMRKGGDLH